MSNIPLKLFVFVLSVIKALFNAITTLVWGYASFFLLAGLIAYFKQDASAIQTLLLTVPIIFKYWLVFFSAIFIYEVLYFYKELIPKDKVVIRTEREPMNEEPLEQIEDVKSEPITLPAIEDVEKEKKRAYMREYMKKYKAKKKAEKEQAKSSSDETAVAMVTDVIESEDEAREKRNAYMRAYMKRKKEERKKKKEEEKVEEIDTSGS